MRVYMPMRGSVCNFIKEAIGIQGLASLGTLQQNLTTLCRIILEGCAICNLVLLLFNINVDIVYIFVTESC